MLQIVGIGPGEKKHWTYAAYEAIAGAELIVGYRTYLALVKPYFPEKTYLESGMRDEEARCRAAITEAAAGKKVVLVCSGDSGIYGLASLVYELLAEMGEELEVAVIPGVTAALSGSALLGAPVAHDSCLISLSDQMTPWETIEKRLIAAATGDFVIALYNPSSHERPEHLKRACELLLRYRSPETVCGIAAKIGRDGEWAKVLTLQELRDAEVDMQTTVFIGNSETKEWDGKMVTPRGYFSK